MIRRARSVKEEVRRSEEARRGYIKAKWKRDCEREREDEEDGGTTGPGRGEVKDSPHNTWSVTRWCRAHTSKRWGARGCNLTLVRPTSTLLEMAATARQERKGVCRFV